MGEADKRVGDLYQIVESPRAGFIGAIVMATEIKSWGIQGFIHAVETFDTSAKVFVRMKWDEIEHVGHAYLIPADEVQS